MGGKPKAAIEAFVPKTTDFSGNPTNGVCYGVVPNTVKGGTGTLPNLQNPILQYDSTNSKLYGCGRHSVLFECYSFDGSEVWSKVDLSPIVNNVYSIPNAYLWFIYRDQIWIVSDTHPRVLDLGNKIGTVEPG
jgi:hypothetical protein